MDELIIKQIIQLATYLKQSKNCVFFGGAGVSTASGIPDFRSNSGLYAKIKSWAYPAEVMLSHSFFIAQTQEFYQFYTQEMLYPQAKPNLAHLALAKLEQQGVVSTIITQNIDGLHQMAGSTNVLELHGSVHRNYCVGCHKFFNLDYVLAFKGETPYCDLCHGIVKPDVVLYEEGLNEKVITASIKAIIQADLLIVGGSSLVVYPAAGFIDYFKGDKLVLINQQTTAYDDPRNVS